MMSRIIPTSILPGALYLSSVIFKTYDSLKMKDQTRSQLCNRLPACSEETLKACRSRFWELGLLEEEEEVPVKLQELVEVWTRVIILSLRGEFDCDEDGETIY